MFAKGWGVEVFVFIWKWEKYFLLQPFSFWPKIQQSGWVAQAAERKMWGTTRFSVESIGRKLKTVKFNRHLSQKSWVVRLQFLSYSAWLWIVFFFFFFLFLQLETSQGRFKLWSSIYIRKDGPNANWQALYDELGPNWIQWLLLLESGICSTHLRWKILRTDEEKPYWHSQKKKKPF